MRGYKNFEGDPHPGDLRHLIEIGYTENQINDNGFPEPIDKIVCRVWAAVTDAGNQAYRSADVKNTEAVVNFTIRYRKDIERHRKTRRSGECSSTSFPPDFRDRTCQTRDGDPGDPETTWACQY